MPTLILLLLMLLLPAASASAAGGGFGDATTIGVDTPVSVPVGDFNEDGRADIVAVSDTTGRVYLHLGQQNGGFVETPSVQVGSYLSQAVAGDFTGDGDLDLAVASFTNQKVHILTGLGDGRLLAGDTITLDRHPTSIAVGDFNADGKEDLAIQNEKSGLGPQLSVRLGTGNGTFTSLPDKATPGEALAISDFNSDQKEDLVFGTGGTPAGGILLGAGTGTFNAGADIALPGYAGISRGWAAGDFNGDGNQDIAASLYDKAQVSVRLGKGDGAFAGGPDLPVGTKPGALAIGDLDGDGDQDLAVANYGSGTVTVWRGGGAGDFVSVGELPVGKEPVELALADFDGDGVDDLAVANSGGGVTVHRGLATPALAGNLLVNGGFEGAHAGGTAANAPDIPGWEATGAITFTRYGAASHAYMPSLADSPRHGTGGSSYLWGGNSAATGGVTAAAQTVDVSAAGASIDAGKATAGLSAYLGGALAYTDRMAARADFLGADGAILGSLEIGPVTAEDRHGLTTMLRRAGAAPVPSRTRRVRVTLTSIDEDKAYSSATADNVKLTLDAPEPPATPAAFGADTRVTLALAARRIKPSAPVRVRVRNGNPFGVTGSVRLGRRTARVQLAPNGRAVVKLRLTTKLRRQLVRRHRLSLRLSAVVRDPAGNRRTVRKRAGIRRTTDA
jgi:hypothetical protein